MALLFIVSLFWAFSFGLIKGRLAGLDPTAVALVRLAFSLLVFLPWLRFGGLPRGTRRWLAAIGAIQFGVMYILYQASYAHLEAHEVALFTIFTPIFVVLLDAALEKRLRPWHLAAAALSVVGTGVLVWEKIESAGFMKGFLFLQGANLCFAAGQIAYVRTRPALGAVRDHTLFGWLYLGAVAVAATASLFSTDWAAFHPSAMQWGVLAYLGVLASGLCFFAWNLGALKVNTGTLAAFNNAKVPLGVACSLLVFGEEAELPRLVGSLVLLVLAVWLAERKGRPATA